MVQPAPLRGWRSAHSARRQLAPPAAAVGRQESEAGDGSRPSSSGRSSSRRSSSRSNSRSIESDSKSRSESGSGMSGRSSSQAKVETILASAGLDPAELQRENPTAYSLLTVPLSQVLAEVHAHRLTTKARLVLQPAQLMARICFVGYDVGLTAEHIRSTYQRSADSLHFDLDGAQQLLAWLRLQNVSSSRLQLASMSNSQLWSVDVGTAQRSKEHIQQRLGVTDEQWAEGFVLQTKGFAARPEVLDGVIAWLQAEPLGISRAEVAQLWRSNPQLFAYPAATLQHNLQSLLSRCPLSQQQLRASVRGPCQSLLCDPEGVLAKLDSLVAELPGLEARLDRLLVFGGATLNLETEVYLGKASCLLQYGFHKQELSRMILQNPMILASSWDGKLQPMLATLEGVLGSRQAVVAAVSKGPQLLSTALDTLKDNFRALQQLELSDSEVQAAPAAAIEEEHKLLCEAACVEELAGKERVSTASGLQYQDLRVGSGPSPLVGFHVVCNYAAMNAQGKVSFMEHKGDAHYKASLSWMVDSDDKFCQRYKYSLVEFRAWEAQWLRSERAREYGLDKARVSGMERALAARQKGSKARVAARRKQRLAGADSKDGAAA
ncbi:hypothetical protein N2152v2_009742 [Parachlorella kessleri]